jgi:hypothetical protein
LVDEPSFILWLNHYFSIFEPPLQYPVSHAAEDHRPVTSRLQMLSCYIRVDLDTSVNRTHIFSGDGIHVNQTTIRSRPPRDDYHALNGRLIIVNVKLG